MHKLYTDGFILERTYEEELRKIVSDIKVESLDITEGVDIEDFLGFNVEKLDSETYHLSQPHIIKQILSDLGLLKYYATPRNDLALTTNMLKIFHNTEFFDQHLHHRSVIGKLN